MTDDTTETSSEHDSPPLASEPEPGSELDPGAADLDGPLADARAALRHIADEAIHRLLEEAALDLFEPDELAGLLRALAAEASAEADPVHAALYEGLATAAAKVRSHFDPEAPAESSVATRADAATENAPGSEGERHGTDWIDPFMLSPASAIEETAATMDLVIGMALALNEAGVLRAEVLAGRWQAWANAMTNGGDMLRGALGTGAAMALREHAGQTPAPAAPNPWDAAHTLSRLGEIAADAIARFRLAAANTAMPPRELRARLFELAAIGRRDGHLERAAILEVLAEMT